MKIIADEKIPFVEDCFSSIGKVAVIPGRQITPAILADADVLLVRTITKVDADLLAGSKIRFVGTATIGFEHIDTEYLARHNIGFASAPASNANSVAEYIIAALLTVAVKYNFNLEEKSIGIIGVGNIGSKVAKKCRTLGMQVLLNDPPLYRQTGDSKYLPLEHLFGCDFITLHTPLTFDGIDKTFHLADEKFFNSLKTGAVFLNTARGGVTDTTALKKTIRSEKLRAAVLDVWENEPNIDTELLKVADIATPHIAGYSFDGKVGGMIMVYEALCKHFGMETKYEAGNFLGPAAVPEIKITETSVNAERILSEIVEKVYNINEDDSKMRRILDVPDKNRGDFFDNLRDNYLIRREFGNTRIILDNTFGPVAAKLKGIGFKISDAKS